MKGEETILIINLCVPSANIQVTLEDRDLGKFMKSKLMYPISQIPELRIYLKSQGLYISDCFLIKNLIVFFSIFVPAQLQPGKSNSICIHQNACSCHKSKTVSHS